MEPLLRAMEKFRGAIMMNISHINFLGFIGGFAPLPPVRRGKKASVDEYPLYVVKKSGAAVTGASGDRLARDISERFLLGGVPVVAPSANFFRVFGDAKNQKRSPVKPTYTEARP